MLIRRRSMLIGAGATVAATWPATRMLAASFSPHGRAQAFGPLVPDPEGLLDLPAGFTYAVLETMGDDMDDGYRVPGAPDGMACFPGAPGTLVLMRNHEVNQSLSSSPYKVGQVPPPQAYDSSRHGGVTRLVVDETTFERISSNLVLVGTIRNCAGGPSPWGWLSCEEDTTSGHGYVFVCPTDAQTVRDPIVVPAYGRFNHEAAAVDPATNICYLTEDRSNGRLYRAVPADKDQPFDAQLQALRVVGMSGYATTQMEVGDIVDIEWVDIDDPDPTSDTVRTEAHGKGAAVFVRGEGIWFFEGAVYVCSTSGGPVGGGQIFRLVEDGVSSTLELIARSDDRDVLDMPDNITVAPWGQVFMAEDGPGQQYVRYLTEDGEVGDFARNALSGSEFAGVCFSPNGRAMFVNIQSNGLTLVVTGPFPELVDPEDPDTDSGDASDSGDTTGSDPSSGGSTSDGPAPDESASGESPGSGSVSASGAADGSDDGSDGGDAGAIQDSDGCGCSTHSGASAAALTAAVAAVLRTRPALADETEPSST